MTNESCNFTVYISKDGDNPGLVVKTLQTEHSCFRTFDNPCASASFLCKYFRNRITKQPEITIKEIQQAAKAELRLNVSKHKCKRAKKMVMAELDASYKVQFGYLAAYAAALKRTNPGTLAEIELCKESLKKGRRVFR